MKPANLAEHRRDRRKLANQTGKRQSVVIVRERNGNSVPAVFRSEGAALKWIKSIVAEPEVGEIYEGKVVKIMDFGAFVNFFGPRDGLVHISELASKRVAKVNDVVKEGDIVKVKLVGVDDRGKVRLSMKVVDQATGQEIPGADKGDQDRERRPREDKAAG